MEQADLVRFVVATLEDLHVPYMVVGSFASGAYGEPRFTQDIDIVIDLQPDQVDTLMARLPPSDFYMSRDAALAAIGSNGQFNVIHPESGNKIDFLIARQDPWGREQLRRRVRIELLNGLDAFAARPEDVIVAKLLYYQEGGSEKHLRDITGMFKLTPDGIDRAYVRQWATQLGVLDAWEAVERRLPGVL
ncbi:MAG: hypothetical protein ABIP55_10975 [Tepidisphaeraceae bacterium]